MFWILGVLIFFAVPFWAERLGRSIARRETGKATDGYFHAFCGLLVSIIVALGVCIVVSILEIQSLTANLLILTMVLLVLGYMVFLRRFLRRNS